MSFLDKDFGTKPTLPPWMAIDPTTNQKETVAGNQSVLPEAKKLGESVNAYTLAQLDKMGGLSAATLKKIGQNIGDDVSGIIPKDIQDMLQNNAATKAYSGGFGGTGMAKNLTARDFGLTSIGLKQQGLNSAMQWMASIKSNSFDVTSMFLSPTQRYQQTSNERDLKFEHDWLQAQIEAMPDPATRGIMDALRQTGIAYLGGTYQQGTNYQAPSGGFSQGPTGGGGEYSDPGYGGGGGTSTNFYNNTAPSIGSGGMSGASAMSIGGGFGGF